MSIDAIISNVKYSSLVLLASAFSVFAGDVSLSGRVVDSTGKGLSDKSVEVYLNSLDKTLSGVTGFDGVFSFNVTSVGRDNVLPDGYSLSNNYPNPFNPATMIDFTLPKLSHVKVDVYDLTGSLVGTVFDNELFAGTTPVRLDLESFGVSAGVYFARSVIDDRYSRVSKLLFLPGSGHAPSVGGRPAVFSKSSSVESVEDVVDSVRVFGRSILPKTEVIDRSISDGFVDLGDIVVDSAFNVDGRIISTMRYDELDNHVPNVNVLIDGYKTVSDNLGNFSLQVPVGDSLRKLDIFSDDIWTRKKHLYVRSDTANVVEDALVREEFPDSVMNFFNYVSSRDGPYYGNVLKRFIDQPIFYIVADTLNNSWDKEFASTLKTFIRGPLKDVMTGRLFPEGFLKDVQIEVGVTPPDEGTKGYYIIRTSTDYGNAVAVTRAYGNDPGDTMAPKIQSARTIFGMYPEPMPFWYMQKLLGHELASGLTYMPRRSNDLQSWYNLPSKFVNATDTDKKIQRAIFSRYTGWDMYDTDWSRSPKNPFSDP